MIKIPDIKILFQIIKDASHVHIMIISFLVLPFVLDAWVSLFQKIPGLKGHELISLIIVFIAFGILLVFAIPKDKHNKKLENIKDLTINYMIANNFTSVGFDVIREKFNGKIAEQEFIEIINTYPDLLRLATIKIDSNNTKPGFGMIKHNKQSNVDSGADAPPLVK